MKKEKINNNLEIIVLVAIIFFLFIGLVLLYEEKIDELENRISSLKEVCDVK